MDSKRKAAELRPLMAIVIIATLIICTSMVVGYYLNLIETSKEINVETRDEYKSRNTQKELNRKKLEKIKTTNRTTAEFTKTSFEESIEDIESDYYEFISRSEYNALPPTNLLKPLVTPIKRVIIAHTVTPNCTVFDQCSNIVRLIQNYHMINKNFDDIALNFLVGGDGRAYEGRGYHVGAHTKGYNFDSICIAFIGDFEEYKAPKRQLLAAQRIIEDGISANNILPEYTLLGQIQVNGFASPGKRLYNQIKSWSRWSNITYISQQRPQRPQRPQRRSKALGRSTKRKKI